MISRPLMPSHQKEHEATLLADTDKGTAAL